MHGDIGLADVAALRLARGRVQDGLDLRAPRGRPRASVALYELVTSRPDVFHVTALAIGSFPGMLGWRLLFDETAHRAGYPDMAALSRIRDEKRTIVTGPARIADTGPTSARPRGVGGAA